MWPFAKKSVRQKEIRRSKAERDAGWLTRLVGRLPALSSVITVASAVLAAVIVNLGGNVLDIRPGRVVPRAITSRVEFSVENEPRTIELRVQARDNAETYYELDVSLLQEVRGRLTNALQLAKEHVDDPQRLSDEARQAKILFDDAGRAELLRIAALTDTEEFKQAVDRFERAVDNAIQKLADHHPFLVEAIDPLQRRTAVVHAILIDPRQAAESKQRSVPVARLRFSNRPETAEPVAEAATQMFSSPLRTSMKATILEILRGEEIGTVKPIYRYLPEESNRAAQDAYDRVPTQYEVHGHDRQLADAGEVSEDEFRLLRHEHEAYGRWVAAGGKPLALEQQRRLRTEDRAAYERWIADCIEARAAHLGQRLATAGYGFLALLITLGLAYHFWQMRPDLRFDPLRQLVTAAVLLGLLGGARAVFVATGTAHVAVGAQAFVVALLAIVFARGPVLAVCGSFALLNTLATRQGVGFFLVLLAVSMALLLGLREVRSRGKIVGAGTIAGLVALLTTVAAGLIDNQRLSFVFWHQATMAAAATLAAAFVIEGILPGIERVFKISTSMALLEWCDASKTLLRMLAADAPGTYNHSLLVGTLGQAAAEAVGANGLLARSGAYYHDIGKINKPEYFTENQAIGVSRHDRLSPAMSHLIIIGHVKDGIEMAKEYGLPASLRPFIPEHHGTSLVQYFYHAASMQRKPGDAEVSDVQFRYPGPKPQTRETAIIMLCDGVEGAVRAMPEPTPGRIEDVVTKIAEQRLMDGQFDECDLTFRELEIIERSLVKSLCAIYHARIQYPEKGEEKKTSEPRAS